MKNKLVIIGASGHGKVILDIALKNKYEVIGFLDDNTSLVSLEGYPVLGPVSTASEFSTEIQFIVGIGSNYIREKIDSVHRLNWVTLIHPSAVIGTGVEIEKGTVVMANAVINPFTRIGRHCIINTMSVVEHDNVIADYVHVSPQSVLAGTVSVGKRTQIGIGASVRNNIMITEDCVVGAGAVVIKNLNEKGTYIGVPARRIKK